MINDKGMLHLSMCRDRVERSTEAKRMTRKINIGNTKVPTSLNVINFGYRIICIKIKDKYCK